MQLLKCCWLCDDETSVLLVSTIIKLAELTLLSIVKLLLVAAFGKLLTSAKRFEPTNYHLWLHFSLKIISLSIARHILHMNVGSDPRLEEHPISGGAGVSQNKHFLILHLETGYTRW